jgi:hypothetical protein
MTLVLSPKLQFTTSDLRAKPGYEHNPENSQTDKKGAYVSTYRWNQSQVCLHEYNTKNESVLRHGKYRTLFHTVLITFSGMRSSINLEAELGDILSAAFSEGRTFSNAERQLETRVRFPSQNTWM